MRAVIAFSLWGKQPVYWKGAERNIELARIHYPGWQCCFYVDERSPSHLVERLSAAGGEIRMMRSKAAFDGAFWRFLPASDPDVDIVLSRDCDSRIGEREAAAVREWLGSTKNFHIMRDHPLHGAPILAGMWGARNRILSNMDVLIAGWPRYEHMGADQEFLAEIVYPLVKGDAFEHSEYGTKHGNPTYPFPTSLQGHHFVGEVFDETDHRHDDWTAIVKAQKRKRAKRRQRRVQRLIGLVTSIRRAIGLIRVAR